MTCTPSLLTDVRRSKNSQPRVANPIGEHYLSGVKQPDPFPLLCSLAVVLGFLGLGYVVWQGWPWWSWIPAYAVSGAGSLFVLAGLAAVCLGDDEERRNGAAHPNWDRQSSLPKAYPKTSRR